MNLKTVVGFAVGPILTASLGLVSVPVIAWHFSAEDVGRLNVFQVTISLCLMLVLVGLDQAYVREYHSTNQKKWLFKACVTPGLILLALITLATSSFSAELSYWLYGESDPVLYFFTIAALAINYLSRFLSLILRMQERGLAFSLSQSIPKAVQLGMVVCVAVLPFQKHFRLLLCITVISFAAALLYYSWSTRKQLLLSNEKCDGTVTYKNLILYGAPLVISGFAYLGINAVSTYSLRTFSNLSELAIYSVAMSFAGAAGIFQAIFSVIWTPLAFKWQAEGADMKKVEEVANAVLAIICILAVIFGGFSWVIDLFLPETYSEVKNILLCCMIQPLLYSLSIVTSVGIGIARKSIYSIHSSILGLSVNLLINYLLTEIYGATGAAIGSALAYLFLFYANSEISARTWQRLPCLKAYLATAVLTFTAINQALYGDHIAFKSGTVWIFLAILIYTLQKKELLIAYTEFKKLVK